MPNPPADPLPSIVLAVIEGATHPERYVPQGEEAEAMGREVVKDLVKMGLPRDRVQRIIRSFVRRHRQP